MTNHARHRAQLRTRAARPALLVTAAGTAALVAALAAPALADATAASPTSTATESATALAADDSAGTIGACTATPSTGTPSDAPTDGPSSATTGLTSVTSPGPTSTVTHGPAPDAAQTAGTWLSGASGTGAADGTLGAWRGRPVDIVGTWDDQGDNQTRMWTIAPGGDTASWDGPLDLAPGGLQPGDTWAQAAAGADDDRWRTGLTTAAHLRAGKGQTYIRPFHEFNGNWYSWKVTPADAGDFVTAWKRYRAIQLQVFPSARLVFNPNVTSSATDLDWRTVWPGADHADVLGVDYYNGYPAITSADDWKTQVERTGDGGIPIGLDAYAAQAKAWGVPLAVPEWSGRASMGDDPAFVTGMVTWFAAHAGTGPGQLAYEVLFNAPQDDGNFQLFGADRLPRSAAAYVAAFMGRDDE